MQLVRFWIGKRCLPSLPSFIENAGKNAFTPNFGPTPTQTSIQLLKVDSVFDTVTPLKSLKNKHFYFKNLHPARKVLLEHKNQQNVMCGSSSQLGHDTMQRKVNRNHDMKDAFAKLSLFDDVAKTKTVAD